IVNTRFVGNEGMMGGAAMILGPASIEGSRFDGNVATIMGGALALTGRETEVEIKDTNFVENESAYGGAIGSDVKKLVIAEGCVFEGNRAEGLAEGEGLPPGGGALHLMGMTGDEVVEILDARFSQNDAMGGGGAIYAELDGAGGGLLSRAGATIRIVNTRFVGNEGMMGGAAMILGPASIEGSRFDGNVATIMGGALALTGRETEVEIKDTNFVENESAYGGAIGSDVKKLVIAEGCVFQGN